MKLFPKTSIPLEHPFLVNKYTQWYYDIINNAKNRTNDGYTELHHIIPDCFYQKRTRKGQPGWLAGDPNDESNTVLLTGEEHLIVHRLLIKMLRELNTGELNARWGKKHSPESRAKISEKRKGYKSTTPNPFKGKKHSLESRLKMSAAHKGYTHSEETRKKMSESQRRRIYNRIQ